MNLQSLLIIGLMLLAKDAQGTCLKKDQSKAVSDVCRELTDGLHCIEPDKATSVEAIKKLTEALSDEEILARVVFSEFSAANCNALSTSDQEAAMEGIAQVIVNRNKSAELSPKYRKRFGEGIKGVVFKKSQFASSFGNYSCSRKTEFLCPQKNPQFAKLWATAKEAAKKSLLSVNSSEQIFKGENKETDLAHNYYLFKHFDNCDKKFPAPEWTATAQSYNPIKASSLLKSCIQFYNPDKAYVREEVAK